MHEQTAVSPTTRHCEFGPHGDGIQGSDGMTSGRPIGGKTVQGSKYHRLFQLKGICPF